MRPGHMRSGELQVLNRFVSRGIGLDYGIFSSYSFGHVR